MVAKLDNMEQSFEDLQAQMSKPDVRRGAPLAPASSARDAPPSAAARSH